MCEISLRDKIYKSLHGKNFVFYCCSEIMTNNYAINQLIPDCLKIYFNVRHFFFLHFDISEVRGWPNGQPARP